jgi:hypothetical protein
MKRVNRPRGLSFQNMLKLCKQTGALYFRFDSTMWLMHLMAEEDDLVELLPWGQVFQLGFMDSDCVN